jgi:hypothetical protein
VDYVWVILLIIGVILLFTWRPILGLFTGVSDTMTNKAGYDRGKEVFYDAELWGGPGSNKSCAMCHAEDFVPDPANPPQMADYKEGEPWSLKGVGKKYGGGIMDTGDDLYKRIMQCLTQPSKMGMGRVSRNAPYMDDLLDYVSKQ